MSESTVKLWEGLLDLPTYAIGVDDPYPPFQRTGNWWIYPYTMQDDLLERREEKSYPGIFMENEYLRLSILPTLGGRLYSVFDKTTEQEVFYRNNVFKPGLIALRGAWISGGIEFNFPQGHTVSTVAPVKCVMHQNDDGSATVTVGDISRTSRMSWSVSISLFPDRAAFQVDIRLENRTEYPQRYYFWSNAAVPATPRMQFVYPMIQATTGRGIVNFPLHEGRDLSWYVNHPRAVDLFAKEPYGDYFGCYDHDTERGVVNVTDARIACGKKFFTWGTAGSGKIWQSLLTDQDGTYCEIQSGRFATQSIHRMMHPHAVESWQETWWPLKQMGGFCYANQLLALQLERQDNAIRIAMNSTEALAGATVTLQTQEAVLYEATLDISPETPFRATLPAEPEVMDLMLEVCVRATDGQLLLDYQEQEREPKPGPAEEDTETVESLCFKARHHEEERQVRDAIACYRKALELDPGSIKAHCGLAGIACKRGLLDEAQEHLVKALTRDPEDPRANWYLGLVLRGKGEHTEAAVHFHRLERFPGYAHLGHHALGELALLAGDWSQAAHHLGDAFQYHMQSSRTTAWMSFTLRRQQQTEAALDIVDSALEQDALNLLLHAEQCFALDSTMEAPEAWTRFRLLMRGDPQAYLEVAMDYINIGAWAEAIAILRIAIDESPDEQSVHPIVHYTLGFCYSFADEPEKMQAHYRLGALMSHRYVFPHRAETLCILDHVLTVQPQDAFTHYYIGNLYMARDRADEALTAWEQATGLNEQLTEAHRNIGLCLWREKSDLTGALAAYEQAIQTAPTSYRLYLDWERIARQAGSSPSERLAFIERSSSEVLRRSEIAAVQAELLINVGRFTDAIELLSAHTFRPWEGAQKMRDLYVQAHLGAGEQQFEADEHQQALRYFEAALEYPTNVGVGEPETPDHATIHEWIIRAAEAIGDSGKAAHHRQMAAK